MTTRLLVIDDSELVPRMLERVLKRHGDYEILEARDGGEGLDVLQRNPDIDLVFLDLRMPGMDGIAFLEARKQLPPALAAIPVVIISAQDSEIVRAAAQQGGATDYLVKPIRLRDLGRIIARHLIRESADDATG